MLVTYGGISVPKLWGVYFFLGGVLFFSGGFFQGGIIFFQGV